MSFGFGVGDFLTVFELAAKIRKQWIDAPAEYASMKNEIKNIESILRDLDDLRQEIDLSRQQNNDLQHASNSCREVLERCIVMIDSYSSVTASKDGTKSRMRRTWKRFHSDPDDVRHMRSQLSSLVGQLTALRDAIHIDMLRDIGGHVEQIGETVGHVYDDTQALRASDVARQTSDEIREKDAIANWFSGSKFADQQNEFMKQRQPGTGKWFLQDHRYQEWSRKQASSPILLCSGAPGSGKTMMFAGIVNDLCDHYRGRKDSVVIYFYCNFNRKDEQDLDQLYACFVRQLFQEQSLIPQEAKALYLKHKDCLTRPSVNDLLVLLRTLIQRHEHVFILIDALDECNIDRSRRNLLIDELISLVSNQPGCNTKVLCTTRPIPEITERFIVFPQIGIRAEEDDLASYLNARMIEISCVNSKADLQENIRSEITRLADGMFLLARLYFESLLGCTKPRGVRKVLADLPCGKEALFRMYDTARARIDHQMDQHRDLAHKVLGWITYARTELTIEELQEAVAIEPGMVDLDHDDDIDDESVIVSVCAGLVTIDQDTRVVRLVHYTTQEYLLRVREHWLPNAQKDIVRACLSFLSMDPFQAYEWGLDLRSYTHKYALLLYAGKQWGFHLTDIDDSEMRTKACSLLCNAAQSTFAAQVMTAEPVSATGSHRSDRDKISPIHICAHFNLVKVCKELITVNADHYDLKDSISSTPLSWAALAGNKEMVELLLQMPGTEMNSKDNKGYTPLSLAVLKSNAEKAKLLKRQPGMEVNFKHHISDRPGPSLTGVVCKHKETIELLLQQPRVDINSKDALGFTPLSLAVLEGNTEIVELLLKRPGIEVWPQRVSETQDPLSMAMMRKNKEIVELLLRQPGVNINSRGSLGDTPLSQAAGSGYTEVVKLLLRQPGLDVNLKNAFNSTPLSNAARYGHAEVVELLLRHPAIEVNCKQDDGKTPLSIAVSMGRKKIVELLLQQPGMNVNVKDDEDGHNLLLLAICCGHKEIVELLLRQPEVNLSFKDSAGNTPLSAAVACEYEQIAELLLRQPGVDAYSKNKFGNTPLSSAVRLGYEKTVEVILRQPGVDVNIRDNWGWTPLLYAVDGGYKGIVELILRHPDVDVNSRDREGDSPLSCAAGRGYKEIVELLLQHSGVDVNSRNEMGFTPIMVAARARQEEIGELLLRFPGTEIKS